jgi:hypothetical protein
MLRLRFNYIWVWAAIALSPACSDGPRCCPPDKSPNGADVRLGGFSYGGSCGVTYDFYCSTNWRIEHDEHGCQVWNYDTRKPAPGEDEWCNLTLDAAAGHEDDAGRGN